jgi:hypothetical protein
MPVKLDGMRALSTGILSSSEREAFGAEESRFLKEVVIAAGVGIHLSGIDVKNSVRELPQKVNIVGNKDQCAFVGLQSEDKRLHSENVEVGRGFVHEQEIGRVHKKFHEVQARFLSSAQNGCFLVDVIALEEERAENTPGLVLPKGSV